MLLTSCLLVQISPFVGWRGFKIIKIIIKRLISGQLGCVCVVIADHLLFAAAVPTQHQGTPPTNVYSNKRVTTKVIT